MKINYDKFKNKYSYNVAALSGLLLLFMILISISPFSSVNIKFLYSYISILLLFASLVLCLIFCIIEMFINIRIPNIQLLNSKKMQLIQKIGFWIYIALILFFAVMFLNAYVFSSFYMKSA